MFCGVQYIICTLVTNLMNKVLLISPIALAASVQQAGVVDFISSPILALLALTAIFGIVIYVASPNNRLSTYLHRIAAKHKQKFAKRDDCGASSTDHQEGKTGLHFPKATFDHLIKKRLRK